MIGYFTDLYEVEHYFEEERLDSAAYDDLTTISGSSPARDEKEAVLRQAFNRIFYSTDFEDVPTAAAATPDELVRLKKAQAEFALYLAIHLRDEDARKGLQAQGVIEAGVVKEKYKEDWMAKTPIPPFVYDLMAGWLKVYPTAAVIDIGRNQDKSAKTKLNL